MIFHPIVGKEIKENTGTFTCSDWASVDVGFRPDVIWITENNLYGKDFSGNPVKIGCGCNFISAETGDVMTFKGTKVSEELLLQQVLLHRADSGFTVAFVLRKMDGTAVTNVNKTYIYHAIKYS